MDISDIVQEYMRKNGYTALYGDGCGCMIDDLAPCGEVSLDCQVGYANHCPSCAKRETCPTRLTDYDFMCLGKNCYEAGSVE